MMDCFTEMLIALFEKLQNSVKKLGLVSLTVEILYGSPGVNKFVEIFEENPLDTGSKLNVHKTLRRRPRRLNDRCTCNLHPVSWWDSQCAKQYEHKFFMADLIVT